MQKSVREIFAKKSLFEIFKNVCVAGYSYLDVSPEGGSNEETREWHYSSRFPPQRYAGERYRVMKIVSLAVKASATRVLEVAASDAFLSACLDAPGMELVVNDIRDIPNGMLEHIESNYRIIKGNLFDIEEEGFDLVLACEIIEHVAHGDRLLEFLKRKLRNGGKIILTTPNGAYVRSRLPTFSKVKDFVSLEKYQYQPDSDGHLYLYTPQEIKKLLVKTGYRNIKIELGVSTWLSGGCGFRFFPRTRFMLPFYYFLDEFTKRLPWFIAEKLCCNLFISAEK